MKSKDYCKKYGRVKMTEKAYHECAICHKTILFVRLVIKLLYNALEILTFGPYGRNSESTTARVKLEKITVLSSQPEQSRD